MGFKMMRGIFPLGVILLSLLMFTHGCGEEPPPPPPRASIPPVAPKPPENPQEKAAVKEEVVYAYNPSGKRDPFRPLILPKRPEIEQKSAPLTPLQQYDLISLKLVGIIWGGELGTRALIIAPDGKGYIVEEETPIGKRNGKIAKITENTIIIEEKFTDFLNQIQTDTIVLEMKKKEG